MKRKASIIWLVIGSPVIAIAVLLSIVAALDHNLEMGPTILFILLLAGVAAVFIWPFYRFAYRNSESTPAPLVPRIPDRSLADAAELCRMMPGLFQTTNGLLRFSPEDSTYDDVMEWYKIANNAVGILRRFDKEARKEISRLTRDLEYEQRTNASLPPFRRAIKRLFPSQAGTYLTRIRNGVTQAEDASHKLREMLEMIPMHEGPVQHISEEDEQDDEHSARPGRTRARRKKNRGLEVLPASDESIEDIVAELDSYVGLENIKQDVRSLLNLLSVRQMRVNKGLKVSPISLHAVFYGPPGTGKTSIARLAGFTQRRRIIFTSGPC